MGLIKKAPTVGSCDQEQNFCCSSANYVNSVHLFNSFLYKKIKRLEGFAPYPAMTSETVPSKAVLVLIWH